MAKYSVLIPAPSAKRMSANCELIIRLNDGWEGETIKNHQLAEGTNYFEFDVPDRYEWAYSTSVVDGSIFFVSCEYSNSTGSRKETRNLVPQKM